MTTPAQIRTLAFVGHGGAGKTTLIESLLARTGAIVEAGSVERGSTVCDYEPLEKEHQHSMKLAAAHIEHQGTRIHLLDTPGFPDFMGQAMCALDAVETVAVVIDAKKGIELTANRMMHWAQMRKLCRMIVVNKIDLPDTDLPALLADIQAAFGRECLPINLPAGGGSRVTDCFFNPGGDADFLGVEAAHGALIDQVVEVDENLMATYLEQGTVEPEQLHAPFEQALRDSHLVPLYGHELGTDIVGREIPIFACPLARFAVSLAVEKGDFVGRQALQRQYDARRRVLAGDSSAVADLPRMVMPIALTDKGVARAGAKVYRGESEVGYVTSGTMVPYWNFVEQDGQRRPGEMHSLRAIALALVDSTMRVGDAVTVDVRGSRLVAKIVSGHLDSTRPPFSHPLL